MNYSKRTQQSHFHNFIQRTFLDNLSLQRKSHRQFVFLWPPAPSPLVMKKSCFTLPYSLIMIQNTPFYPSSPLRVFRKLFKDWSNRFQKALETKLPFFVGEKHICLTPKFTVIQNHFLSDPHFPHCYGKSLFALPPSAPCHEKSNFWLYPPPPPLLHLTSCVNSPLVVMMFLLTIGRKRVTDLLSFNKLQKCL